MCYLYQAKRIVDVVLQGKTEESNMDRAMSKSTVPCWYCTGLCYMVVLARRVSQPSQRHCSICFHGCAEKPADSHGHDGAEFAYVQQRLTYRCTAHAKQPRAHAMMLFHAA